MSVAISRVMIHREYARLRQGSLASLAHLYSFTTLFELSIERIKIA